jgi:hypothetical protein
MNPNMPHANDIPYQEKVDLLRHRCSIKPELYPDDDLWPYDDPYKENK